MILLDTNILIEVLKNNKRVVNRLNNMEDDFMISSIAQMELFYGAFNKREIKKLEKFFLHFETVYIDENISKLAMDLIKKYAKSHNLSIPDSLIAATAIVKRCYLYTLNIKDFHYINGIRLLEV